jgi:outer membrane protein assembly factor BamA
VVLEGNTAPLQPSELIAQMHRGPGKTFQLADARTDADNMRRFLDRRDFRKAEVRYLNYTYDKTTKKVTVRYRAVTGPVVQVDVAGVPRHDVSALIPFRKNQQYSEDALETSSNNIIKRYQDHGYFNAAVDIDGSWSTSG